MICSAFQNWRRVPPRIFIYVQNVPRLFGARHFSLFFLSVWPQFLVNRASSTGTLRIAILGQHGCPAKQAADSCCSKHRLSLASSKIISVSFTGLHDDYWKLSWKISKWLLICMQFIHIYCIQKALSHFWQNLRHDILVEGKNGSFTQPGKLSQEYKVWWFFWGLGLVCLIFVVCVSVCVCVYTHIHALEKPISRPTLLDSMIALFTNNLNNRQLILYIHI